MILRGVELNGGLRDYYLALLQKEENEAEYLKVFINAQSQFGKPEEINKHLARLRYLLGMEAGDYKPKKDEWMNNPSQVDKYMKLLKNMKVSIGIVEE